MTFISWTGISTVHSNCTSGDLRLAGGVSPESGRLEMCVNQAWGTVCNRNFRQREAVLACRELGFQPFYGKCLV